MPIDMHSHIWQDQLDDLPAYLNAIHRSGVEKSVVLVLESWRRNVTADEVWRGASTNYVAQCVATYPDRLVLFGTLPPQLDDSPDMLQDLVQQFPNMKGLKLHPAIQGFDPSSAAVTRFVRKAAELGLPITIHAGDVGWVGRLAHNDPYYLDDLATAVPEATLIVAHGGASALVPWIVARHANMYMDTSYAPNWPSLRPMNWKFQCLDEDLVSFVGAKKIVFGTDMNPVIFAHETQMKGGHESEDAADRSFIAAAAIDAINALRISDTEKALILTENAEKLLSLR